MEGLVSMRKIIDVPSTCYYLISLVLLYVALLSNRKHSFSVYHKPICIQFMFVLRPTLVYLEYNYRNYTNHISNLVSRFSLFFLFKLSLQKVIYHLPQKLTFHEFIHGFHIYDVHNKPQVFIV